MTEPAFVFSRILPPDVSARVVTEPNRLNVETSTPLVWLPGVSDPVLRYDPTFCETPLGIARVVTEPRRLNVEASAPAANARGSATRTRAVNTSAPRNWAAVVRILSRRIRIRRRPG